MFAPQRVEPPLIAVRDGVVLGVGTDAWPYGRTRRLRGTVTPALVDLQVNGGAGVDLQHEGPDLARLHAWLRQGGILTYAPTLISASVPAMLALAARLTGESGGVRALSPHFEGPFISVHRLGAHQAAPVAGCGPADVIALGPHAGMVTLAPERAGGLEAIRALTRAGVRVSLGHSAATFEEAEAGFDAGAVMATHLFNAMEQLHHRRPGLVGAVLAGAHSPWAGLIADGDHVHPEVVRMASRLLGERMVVVSDAVAAALDGTGASRLARPSGTVLAGSLTRLDRALANLIAWGVDPAAAVTAVTASPAAAARISDRGRLEPGRASLVAVFDETWRVVGSGPLDVIAGQDAGV